MQGKLALKEKLVLPAHKGISVLKVQQVHKEIQVTSVQLVQQVHKEKDYSLHFSVPEESE